MSPLYLLRREGVWDRALAAAVFAAFEAFLLLRVLPAALAAFLPVCLELRGTLITAILYRVSIHSGGDP